MRQQVLAEFPSNSGTNLQAKIKIENLAEEMTHLSGDFSITSIQHHSPRPNSCLLLISHQHWPATEICLGIIYVLFLLKSYRIQIHINFFQEPNQTLIIFSLEKKKADGFNSVLDGNLILRCFDHFEESMLDRFWARSTKKKNQNHNGFCIEPLDMHFVED